MKKIILTSEAPAPIGPYSQAVQVGQQLFISGQIPLDPATGALISGSIEEETTQVMKNLTAVLSQAGGNWESVVKVSIFLSDMADFAAVNKIYGQYIPEKSAPARETVAVAGLPKGVRVEISAIAFLNA
ncbi:MAG: RidA family protein [Flavobacteriaceae bacterium]|jgi:2-iminobutanoate/2-iminopropanoate deaminase